jgi:predicted MFS family arabinose efflux permease
MISLLSSLYFLYGFVLFYSYLKGYSLLKYLLNRKNINAVLTIELVFIVLCSLIVFTSQPLNWIVALIMFTHVTGVSWLISSPDTYYSMANSDSVNMDSLETASAMIVFGYGVFIYSSKFFLG